MSCFDCETSNEQEFNEAYERISQRLRDEAFPAPQIDAAVAEIRACNGEIE